MKFTIAIPTHDRRETALLAVRSALDQTHPAEEVLVLCDGCGDGTAAAVAAVGDPRVRALELPKAPGYGYAHRTRSLELATGEAIVWLGDDDLLLPDHLERLGERWDAGDVDLVVAPAVVVHSDDRLEWAGRDWSIPAHAAALERGSTSPMSAVSVRTALARDVGGWDATLPRHGDLDLWRRLLAAGARPAMTDEPTVLNFRATGRAQPAAERVAQNARWLARAGDPALRRELRRVRALREAELYGRVAELDALRDEQAAVLARRDADVADAAREIERLRAEAWTAAAARPAAPRGLRARLRRGR